MKQRLKMLWMVCCFGLAVGLSSCVAWSEIPEYVYYADTTDNTKMSAAIKKQWQLAKLTLDRAKKTITLTMPDGKTHILAFEVAPREKWPMLCPGNYSHSRVEYLLIQKETLELGGLSFKKPILRGSCYYDGPQGINPDYVYLTELSNLPPEPSSTNSPEVTFRTKINCDPNRGPCG